MLIGRRDRKADGFAIVQVGRKVGCLDDLGDVPIDVKILEELAGKLIHRLENITSIDHYRYFVILVLWLKPAELWYGTNECTGGDQDTTDLAFAILNSTSYPTAVMSKNIPVTFKDRTGDLDISGSDDIYDRVFLRITPLLSLHPQTTRRQKYISYIRDGPRFQAS
ncbi:hypothetical protein EDC04DRAFT_2899367 [Pisolithus marmoratus]|nr:hypothetical protein EDC04DRAFT_2899367 [Pisolithus marmoratus]